MILEEGNQPFSNDQEIDPWLQVIKKMQHIIGTPPCAFSQMCAIYIAMQRYLPISVILSDIVMVRIRHGLTIILSLKIN